MNCKFLRLKNGILRQKFCKTEILLLLFSLWLIAPVQEKLCAVSVIEPFRPYVSVSSMERSAHSLSVSLVSSEKYLEIPFHIFYGITDEIELETRWGFIYNSSEAGMSDMKFSAKYNLAYFDKDSIIAQDKTERASGISAEAGVSLPTGDHTRGLGEGGVGILLGWNIRQNFDKDVMGYLGLGGNLNNRELVAETARIPVKVFSYTAGVKYFYSDDILITAELKGFNNYFSKNSLSTTDFLQELYFAPGIFYKGGKIPITSAAVLIGLSPDARKIILYLDKKF